MYKIEYADLFGVSDTETVESFEDVLYNLQTTYPLAEGETITITKE